MKNAIIALLFLACASLAADVTLSGTAETDFRVGYDKDFSPTTYSNHAISLTTAVGLDEGVTAEIYTEMHSYVTDSVTGEQSWSAMGDPNNGALNGDGSSHWAAPEFGGIQLTWNFTHGGTFRFGDLSYSAGQTNLTRYHSAPHYGAILKTVYLTGVGLDFADGQVMMGAFDENSKSMIGYAGYDFPVINRTNEKWTVKPVADLLFGGGGRKRRYTLGTETRYSRSWDNFSYGIYGAGAMIPRGSEDSWTLLAEPNLQYKDFSLAFTGYHAFLGHSDLTAAEQTDMPVQRFASVEPGVTVHPKISLGLLFEYIDPSVDEDGDEFKTLQPTVYLYPTAGAELTTWVGYSVYHEAPNLWNLGISASMSF